MKASGILILLLAAIPSAYAADGTADRRAASEHRGHDHAAMSGMGKSRAWTIYPILKTRMSGDSRESMVISLVPQNIVAGSVEDYSNDLSEANAHTQLPIEMGGARFDRKAKGGFHILTVREEQANLVRVASAVYYNGERGANNPTAMFMQQKSELEIIPQPYPREHSRYRAGEVWKFLVRFNGSPLPGQKVYLETSNGSMAEFLTDAQGVFTLRVPDDFKAEEESKGAGGHNHGRPGAEFVLATEHEAEGKSYLTAFNSSYGKNAYDQRSLALGLGFTLLGMLGAAPLLRKRKTAKKSEEAGHA
jgi:hypothetical protein